MQLDKKWASLLTALGILLITASLVAAFHKTFATWAFTSGLAHLRQKNYPPSRARSQARNYARSELHTSSMTTTPSH